MLDHSTLTPVLRVGLIADTHGVLREEAVDALRSSDSIVHAGDICDPAILQSLARIAPVTAVRGNNDRGAWAKLLPATTTLAIAGVRILVVHDLATLAIDPHRIGANVVVSGHSHRPSVETRDGVLYINPGSAGPRRFRLPVSVGHLLVRGRDAVARLETLALSPPLPSAPRPTGADTRSARPSPRKAGASARAPRR